MVSTALCVCLLSGCNREERSVLVSDLTGVYAYRGDWVPTGGNPPNWRRPVFSASMKMNPPIKISADGATALITRTINNQSVLEAGGEVFAKGWFRGTGWRGECVWADVIDVTVNGFSYSGLGSTSELVITPDRTHWLLLASDGRDGRRVIVDGKLIKRLGPQDPAGQPRWVGGPGAWQAILASTPYPNTDWKTLDGASAPPPAGFNVPWPKPPAVDVKVDLENPGPERLTVNNRTIGEFTHVLRMGSPSDNASRWCRLDPDGRLSFYVIDADGQLVRLRVSP